MTTEAQVWSRAQQILTAPQLQALQMRYHDELPVDTIAAHLNISRQAVYARLKSATGRLEREFPELRGKAA